MNVYGRDDLPEDTRWVRAVLELRNDGDAWVQLQREFTVDLVGPDGSSIATGGWFIALDALDDCSAVDPVVTVREPPPMPDGLVPDEFLCTTSEDGSSVLGGWYVTNDGAEDVVGIAVIGIRDASGRRVATNRSPELTYSAGATLEVTAGVVAHELPDPAAPITCELLGILPPEG